MKNLDEILTKIGYIISVSESCHPRDTDQRKMQLMVKHAKEAREELTHLQDSLLVKHQEIEKLISEQFGELDSILTENIELRGDMILLSDYCRSNKINIKDILDGKDV